jgi:hypothetical protein
MMQQQQAPPMQSQWGRGMPQGMMGGRPQYPQQQQQGQPLPNQQQQQGQPLPNQQQQQQFPPRQVHRSISKVNHCQISSNSSNFLRNKVHHHSSNNNSSMQTPQVILDGINKEVS